MADNEELIGGIGITISGDYSSLKDSYSQAQADAAAAGEAVADAFNNGVESVSDASKVVADGLSGISDAADSADGSLGQFADAAETAGEASEQAGGKLADMAEKLTAVGEALVITEGLKELGTEALGAADSITRASIALTTITGSGDSAKETIEGLEQLGMSDGLSMPSLLSAATRMQQILGPSTDVADELRKVADGASVMGTDIETAAQKFDQIASAGTASARTLTALGISLAGLATAFNQVVAGANETASSVAASFQALDQSERIDVLNAALAKLGGTAQQVAEQTFGGQWQQLANAWEGIMVQVGQAILPVVSDILELTKTDIVPFIQGAVEAFTALPEPIKDTAVAVGIAVAAVIPLTGALAALGLGVSGLQTLLPTVTGLFTGLGEAAEVAAPEIAGVGVAAEAAEGTLGALGVSTVAAGGLIAALAVGVGVAAVVGFQKWQDSMNAAKSTLQGLSDTDLQNFLNGIATLKQGTGDAGTATEQWEAKLVTLKEALDNGTISAKQYETAVKAIEAAQDSLSKQNLADSLTAITGGLKLVVDQAQKATDQQTLLNQVLSDSQAAFQKVKDGYQAGTDTAQQYLTAQKNVQTATEAITKAQTDASNAAMEEAIAQTKVDQEAQVAAEKQKQLADVSTTTVDIQKQMLATLQDQITKVPLLSVAWFALDGAITTLQSAMPGFGVVVTNISTGPLAGLQNALQEANDKVAGFAAQMAAGQNVGQQYEKALTAAQTAQVNLNVAVAEAGTGLQGATDAYSLATIAVAAAQAKLDTLTAAFQTNVSLAPQVTAAQNALAAALKNQAAASGSSTEAVDLLSQQYPQLNTAVDTTTAAINTQTTSLQNNATALNGVAAAVKGVEADISNALGLASSGSATGGTGGAGGPGWVTTNTGMHGDFGQPITSTSYVPNTTQQALQGAIDAGEITVAQALQTEQAYNSIGYNDNWTFTPKGGGSTAAQAGSTQAGASGVQQSGVVLDPTQNAPALPGTTTASTGTVSSGSTPVVSSTSGGGTSAVDGGSYPAVTAHQAVGEVWAVSTSGQSGGAGGGGSTSITTSISNTLSGGSTDSASLQAATQAIGGAVQQIATNSGDLLPISASLQATAQSTAALAVAVGGLVVKLGGGTSGSLPTVTGGSGTAYSVGPTQTYSGSGNPLGDTAPPSNTPVNTVPGYNPFGGGSSPGPTSSGAGSQVTVNVDARGAVGINTAAMSAQISAIVGTTLVANLRAQGARF